MSILLEALRKSERRERLGEVPNIHQDEQPAGRQGRASRRPLLILLLLLVVLILGWLFWRQYAPPPPAPVATVVPGPVVEETLEQSVAAVPPPGQARPAPLERSGPRTPMEGVELPPPQSDAAQAAEPEPAGQEPQVATPQQETFADRPRPALVTIDSVPVPPAQDAAGVEPDQPPRDDRGLEPISYWQLPDAIRSTLPPMKISVLVYAEQAAERFVLMDGRRRIEGDSVMPGLELIEVRRDGVVMSYQAYRFLVRH